MTCTRSKFIAHPVIDISDVYEPPLDYTFKCLTTVSDYLEEDPRIASRNSSRGKTKSDASVGGDELKWNTNAVRLTNNVINDWREFSSTIMKLVVNPVIIEWIDLSFNDITTIDECLMEYPNLKVLYLHGNAIEKISEIDKLAKLPFLKCLTLHGNPIEELKGIDSMCYHDYLFSRISTSVALPKAIAHARRHGVKCRSAEKINQLRQISLDIEYCLSIFKSFNSYIEI